jgi:hypothetical protein
MRVGWEPGRLAEPLNEVVYSHGGQLGQSPSLLGLQDRIASFGHQRRISRASGGDGRGKSTKQVVSRGIQDGIRPNRFPGRRNLADDSSISPGKDTGRSYAADTSLPIGHQQGWIFEDSHMKPSLGDRTRDPMPRGFQEHRSRFLLTGSITWLVEDNQPYARAKIEDRRIRDPNFQVGAGPAWTRDGQRRQLCLSDRPQPLVFPL